MDGRRLSESAITRDRKTTPVGKQTRCRARVDSARHSADIRVEDFVERHFQPYYQAKYPPPTARGMDRYWKVYLKDAFSGHRLQKFTTADASKLLTDFAKRGLGRFDATWLTN